MPERQEGLTSQLPGPVNARAQSETGSGGLNNI